ncbi:hypothetical protein CCHR01_17918 [Colletotrichum chrysophilum]|uniref:Uncharacterized protein n=1 Tax=Colletotrichum chrysophilum TaxID=1836956 RepID=A0AAD9A3D8_9PEZI|nr:hypothetical protein CCHR01_17918 [Colletotrichum chrysophilum]
MAKMRDIDGPSTRYIFTPPRNLQSPSGERCSTCFSFPPSNASPSLPVPPRLPYHPHAPFDIPLIPRSEQGQRELRHLLTPSLCVLLNPGG